MNAAPTRPRYLIPRWHFFATSARERNFGTATSNRFTIAPSFLDSEIEGWCSGLPKSVGMAVHLLGSALQASQFTRPEIREAASIILSSDAPQDSGARALANSVFGIVPGSPFETGERRVSISVLKCELRVYARNPAAWIDLARLYVDEGQLEKANRAILVGLNLDSHSRFVNQSAVRYFLHIQDAERALMIARKAAKGGHDILSMATEIAVSQLSHKTPASVKYAKSALRRSEANSKAGAELAVTMSHLELHSGSDKKAKKLLRWAIPNLGENSAAQAVWLAPHLNFSEELKDAIPENAFEAKFRFAQSERAYREAALACEEAVRFHPIASSLAVEGSYIAATKLLDFEQSVRIIDACNPDSQQSFMLHNNKAYSLSQLGRIDDALSSHSRAALLLGAENRDRLVHMATKGAIEFRRGNILLARLIYRGALDGFAEGKFQRERELVTACWAMEERNAQTGVVSDSSFLEGDFSGLNPKPWLEGTTSDLIGAPSLPIGSPLPTCDSDFRASADASFT